MGNTIKTSKGVGFCFAKPCGIAKKSWRVLLALSAFLGVSFAANAAERTWNTAADVGWIDEPSSWTGSTPPESVADTAKITAPQGRDLTVLLPTHGFQAGQLNLVLEQNSSLTLCGTNRDASASTFFMAVSASGDRKSVV